MSAKKKTAKKAATKKTAKKKSAVKKTAAKKAIKKKAATKKEVSKKTTPKKAAAKKVSKKKSTKKAVANAKSSSSASSKKAQRAASRISMSLEEIRVLLKRRKKEEAEAKKEAQKAATKIPTKKLEPIKEEEVKNSRHAAASLDDILGLSSPISQTNSVPKKWKKYYNILISLRDEVRQELNLHSSDTLKKSQKEDGGETVTSSDAGTDTFDRDFALNLLSSEQEALKEIEAAIDRIYKGTYGNCEVTGEKISNERLMAVPFTRFSLEGQREFENNRHRKVQRAGAFLNEADGEKITFGDDDGDN